MKSILFAVLLVLFLASSISTQQPAATTSSNGQESGAAKYFTDIQLVNQNGEKMRFYSDLLQGKTVVINTFFATCQASCLPITRNLEKVQDALGDRLGKDAFLQRPVTRQDRRYQHLLRDLS